MARYCRSCFVYHVCVNRIAVSQSVRPSISLYTYRSSEATFQSRAVSTTYIKDTTNIHFVGGAEGPRATPFSSFPPTLSPCAIFYVVFTKGRWIRPPPRTTSTDFKISHRLFLLPFRRLKTSLILLAIAQTPLVRFVVDLLRNQLYNMSQ